MPDTLAVMGTGLISLDVIDPPGEADGWATAGGTCGNVLRHLAWLGWRSHAVGRVGEDVAGDRVVTALELANVDTTCLTRSAPTPIIIERVNAPGSPKTHRFVFACPDCDAWFPRFRPITRVAAREVTENQVAPDVFFFDRVSPGIVELAEWAGEAGAFVVFEPSAKCDEGLLARAIVAADLVKYAEDRAAYIVDAVWPDHVTVVETLGASGARWRTGNEAWNVVAPPPQCDIIDTAGAGDWCTAVLLDELGHRGRLSRREPIEGVEEALNIAQLVAALSCSFIGSSGLADAHDADEVRQFTSGGKLGARRESKQHSYEHECAGRAVTSLAG